MFNSYVTNYQRVYNRSILGIGIHLKRISPSGIQHVIRCFFDSRKPSAMGHGSTNHHHVPWSLSTTEARTCLDVPRVTTWTLLGWTLEPQNLKQRRHRPKKAANSQAPRMRGLIIVVSKRKPFAWSAGGMIQMRKCLATATWIAQAFPPSARAPPTCCHTVNAWTCETTVGSCFGGRSSNLAKNKYCKTALVHILFYIHLTNINRNTLW